MASVFIIIERIMENSKLQAEELIDRYLAGDCSVEERNFVERTYTKTALNKTIEDKPLDFNRIGSESWKHILTSVNKKAARIYPLWMQFAAAAAIVLVVSAGFWFYNSRRFVTGHGVVVINDVLPGKNTATLTLASGKIITLGSGKTGLVIGASKLTYTDGSIVTADLRDKTASGTISTPRGGQYQVKLPDGTGVWLNSASTLRFSGMSAQSAVRQVELTGEAYFEVAKVVFKDKYRKIQRKPFVVKGNEQEVHVLGTHFNINNYQDLGAVTTTLVEGSVRVITRKARVENVLKPGEQSLFTANGQVKIMPANVKEVLAWKNGYFRFNGSGIDQVMTELSRWYDIEVDYQGKMSGEKFTGNISKYKNISEVLSMLSYSNAVKFKIEGRRVTVMN